MVRLLCLQLRAQLARAIALTLAITSLCDAQMHEDRRAVKESHPLRRMGWKEKLHVIFLACAIVGGLAVMIYGVVLVMSRREEQRIREYYKNKDVMQKSV